MTRHTVHTNGAPCGLCHRHRRVIYIPRTPTRRPHTALLCDTCDWMPADNAPTWAETEETNR